MSTPAPIETTAGPQLLLRSPAGLRTCTLVRGDGKTFSLKVGPLSAGVKKACSSADGRVLATISDVLAVGDSIMPWSGASAPMTCELSPTGRFLAAFARPDVTQVFAVADGGRLVFSLKHKKPKLQFAQDERTAAHLVTNLQTIVSREIGPLEPCVVTVAAIHAGTVHNIIADSCELLGTIRSLSPGVRARAEAALRRFCAGMETSFRTPCELDWIEGVPPTMNAEPVLEASVGAIRRQMGDVFVPSEPSMGAEDFALIAARVPSFVLRVGSGAVGRTDHLHNSGYQPDEACIALGATALARAAVDLLAA